MGSEPLKNSYFESKAGRPVESDTNHLPHVALSNREAQILTLLSLCLTNKEIARRLHISPETVKTHVASIFRKLGVKNRVHAAMIASRVAVHRPVCLLQRRASDKQSVAAEATPAYMEPRNYPHDEYPRMKGSAE